MPPKRNKSSRPDPSPYASIDVLEKKFRREKETRRDAEAELERVQEELEESEDNLRNAKNSLDTVLKIIDRLRDEAHGTEYTNVEDFIFDMLPDELKRCRKCNTLLDPLKLEISCPLCRTPF